MTPADLLARCRALGVELGAVGDALLWECPGDPPGELLADLKANAAAGAAAIGLASMVAAGRPARRSSSAASRAASAFRATRGGDDATERRYREPQEGRAGAAPTKVVGK
jgi:hypothetical protein